MNLFKSSLTTPELLGRLRHFYTALGAVLLGIGLTTPDWMPVVFSETFTAMLFVFIGSAIDIVQVLRSINSPEKKMMAGRSVGMLGLSISPELAGTIRQILTMLGMLLVVFKIPVPDVLSNVFTEQGINMIVDIIGSVITYISFVLSKNAKEKKVSEVRFAEMRTLN